MLVRLTESDLHRIVENAVLRTLNEIGDTERGKKALSQVAGRSAARAMMGKNDKVRKDAARMNKMATSELQKNGASAANGADFRTGFQKGMTKLKESGNNDIENGERAKYENELENPLD